MGFPDLSKAKDGRRVNNVDIRNYLYAQGDMSYMGSGNGRPPLVAPGASLRFTNWDATSSMTDLKSAYHTVTACKNPCNKTTGIAYPLADADIPFDSGELGYGPGYATPTINRNTWSTPKTLARGTYSYFCRIHPFMRGAFRVK